MPDTKTDIKPELVKFDVEKFNEMNDEANVIGAGMESGRITADTITPWEVEVIRWMMANQPILKSAGFSLDGQELLIVGDQAYSQKEGWEWVFATKGGLWDKGKLGVFLLPLSQPGRYVYHLFVPSGKSIAHRDFVILEDLQQAQQEDRNTKTAAAMKKIAKANGKK